MSFAGDIDSLCTRLRRGEIERQTFVDECARIVCEAVGCTRAGLWVFTGPAEERSLRCLGVYDSLTQQVMRAEDRLPAESGAYFSHLRRTGHVMAPDAASHPATRDFYAPGLSRFGIVSLMSVAFSLNGELFGAFTCSQVDSQMHWTTRQLATVKRIGSRATLALAAASPHQLDTFFGSL